jgi:hypothetical protein
MENEMETLVLGEQAGDPIMMFTTRFSYDVIEAMETFFGRLTKSKKKEPLWKTFDKLYALTFVLHSHDHWMFDHEVGWGREWGGAKVVKRLAKEWKDVLGHSDEELGIDKEYMRPGIVCMLEQFKRKIDEDIEDAKEEGITFKFQ